MKNLVWLASYPKSGNTWVRAFLSSVLAAEHDFLLNKLVGKMASSRELIENELCIETSDLSIPELEELRPLAFRSFAKSTKTNPYFIKTHDAYTYTISGEPIFPADVSIGAVYIVRNPLDVATSYTHHGNTNIDKVLRNLNNDDYFLCKGTNGIRLQIQQKLLSWSSHVLSWLQQQEMPVLVIRYEDLITDPLKTFRKICFFCHLQFEDTNIQKAIDVTSFDKLQSEERSDGFRERPMKSESPFFRKGKIGSWKEELTDNHVKLIIDYHKETMLHLGYLDVNGKPVF